MLAFFRVRIRLRVRLRLRLRLMYWVMYWGMEVCGGLWRAMEGHTGTH